MIKEWIDQYKPQNSLQADQALREILQEIALAGLGRSGFFEKAAFYGGTALRIFHGLPRFSEDLDFSLLAPDPDFELQPHLDEMQDEFSALGISVRVAEKNKSNKTHIDSAFLKADTTWKELVLRDIIPQERTGSLPEIRIKLEVDTAPPPGFTTEENLLVKPFSFYVKCFSLPDLFAGKMHALLFRKWKNRVKGRDWFDLEWYIQKGVTLNLDHLQKRAVESGDRTQRKITRPQLIGLLTQKINSVSFGNIREDIVRFIPDARVLDIWSPKYFTDLIQKIRTNP
ncbi:MAG TPA: nucleotidyl transferase AbiEii/AbiGii toxin family protein [Puia sp.]|nr:nucleotidyl transferase AbiEii/AbiGii toxin family protein [Puia sp.]